MNGSAKKLMAVLLVSVMIASAVVVVMVDEQDSSAEPFDVTDYYRNKLEMDFSKTVYDRVCAISDFGSLEIEINSISEDDKATMIANESDPYFVSKMINKGIIAAVYDNPLVGYYIDSTSPASGISHTGGYDSVSFTVNKVDPTDPAKAKSIYDAEMATAIESFYDSVDPLASTSTKITTIHNYVANSLTYNKTGDATRIRSVYTTLCGDKNVVCEGYAKMFKVLCDRFDIPCLIVTGTARTTGEPENHMWNYVEVEDDHWHLVDCTWDDQQDGPMASIVDDYLMAGTGTVGFNSVPVGTSHTPTGLDTGFSVSDISLRYSKYNSGITEYLVTFLYEPELDPLKVYQKVWCGAGTTVILPEDPADDIGHYFFGWYNHDSDTIFDSTTPITGDITVDGKWVYKEVYALKYDTQGGTNIQATRVEYDNNTTKVTDIEPRKEGFEFKEWNTSKDGKGMTYHGGEDITLIGDCTLYAIWDDTSSVTYKIDNWMEDAADFLSQESIPGISNFLLTIGVITTVVSLIAILAIARK